MSTSLLNRLHDAGAIVTLDGDSVRVKWLEGRDPELYQLVQAHKDDVVAHLQGRDVTLDPEPAPKLKRRSYPCSRCDRIGLFPSPDAVCYWCRHPDPDDYDEREREAIRGEHEVAA